MYLIQFCFTPKIDLIRFKMIKFELIRSKTREINRWSNPEQEIITCSVLEAKARYPEVGVKPISLSTFVSSSAWTEYQYAAGQTSSCALPSSWTQWLALNSSYKFIFFLGLSKSCLAMLRCLFTSKPGPETKKNRQSTRIKIRSSSCSAVVTALTGYFSDKGSSLRELRSTNQ